MKPITLFPCPRFALLAVALAVLAFSQTSRATIIFDNFDGGGGFHPQDNLTAAAAFTSFGTTDGTRAAAQFTVTGGNFSLSSITLPISVQKDVAGNFLRIRLASDVAGVPGPTLEVLSENQAIWPDISNPFTTTTTISSLSNPLLYSGQTYWIVAEPTAAPPGPIANVDYRWFLNAGSTSVPVRQQSGPGIPSDPWSGFSGSDNVAFRVEGVINMGCNPGKVIWAGNFSGIDTVDTTDLTGATHQHYALSGGRYVALNRLTGKIYYADNSTLPGRVWEADKDGSGERLVTTTVENERVDHIAVDPNAGTVYWDDSRLGNIRRADISTGAKTFIMNVITDLRGIAVDDRLTSPNLYYYDGNFIYRANLDGSGVVKLPTLIGDGGSGQFALDTCQNRVYVIGNFNPHPGPLVPYVRWMSLDGATNYNTVLQGLGNVGNISQSRDSAIGLDLHTRTMYWTCYTTTLEGQIRSANMDDGSALRVLPVSSSVAAYESIALCLADYSCGASCSNTVCAPLLSRAWPSPLVSITVWEGTGNTTPHTFPVDLQNPDFDKLRALPGGPSPTRYDFNTGAAEYYDVYLCDPNGNPTTNGCCVKVACYIASPSFNYATGGNIDAVELDFEDDTHVGAWSIGDVHLGAGITDAALVNSSGQANNALGLHDTNDTLLGFNSSSITLCFPEGVPVACPCFEFDCPPNIVTSSCSNVLLSYAPVVTGVCASNATVICTPASPHWFAPGTVTTVHCVAVDNQGHSVSCDFTVSVMQSDTTPPVIICDTNTRTVRLEDNCQLRIPRIHPRTIDNCTPGSKLVYTQIPEAGTLVAGPCQDVLVTVTDLRGNASHCGVTVCGVAAPPRISCPGAITISNCVIPNVRGLVSWTGCGMADHPGWFYFSQSPEAGSPIGPGVNSISFTITGQGGSDTCVIPIQFTGPTSFLDQLFNTGVDASRVILTEGAIDPHYAPTQWPFDATFSRPTNAVVTQYPWFAPPNSSKWIGPATNAGPYETELTFEPGGHYAFEMTSFALPIGANPNAASISGRWAADNSATMFLNGIPVASLPNEGFKGWTPFTISGAGLFHANPNPNTITFNVFNANKYTGFRAEFTSAYANCSNCAPVTIASMTGNQSLPQNGKAVIKVIAVGTPLLSYQWYRNGKGPLTDTGNVSGSRTSTLTVSPLDYGSGGTYYVIISNACGSVGQTAKVSIAPGWPWPWAWWTFSRRIDPMAAIVGPNLVLAGSSTLGIVSGTPLDFGLPNPGGAIASVIHIPQLFPSDATIQLPFIASPGSNTLSSYSLVMDVYAPSISSGTNRILLTNHGRLGQDGYTWMIDSQNFLHLAGFIASQPFDAIASVPVALDTWNRLALVIDDPMDGVGVNLYMYLNGQLVSEIAQPITAEPVDGLAIETNCPSCPPPPTLLSSANGQIAEFYSSGIQFHAVALTPEIVAGFGSPVASMLANIPAIGAQPLLTTTVSNGIVNFSWIGSPYVLQETVNLTSGIWVDSALPFIESQTAGGILTTAICDPISGGPGKFYRLIFAP